MRVGYSILREIHRKEYLAYGSLYGIKDFEFDRMIKLLEKQGYLIHVLRAGDKFSLRPSYLSKKGEQFLLDNKNLEDHYPNDKNEIIKWIQIDKKTYSNDNSDE